jgi:hypothetical protein
MKKLVKDEKLKHPKNMANASSNFFLTVTEKLNVHYVRKINDTRSRLL